MWEDHWLGVPGSIGGGGTSLDGAYINGVSVTHGSPRQHIWSFVNGLNEVAGHNAHNCPCVAESTMEQYIPSFVGQNYFCETGVTRSKYIMDIMFSGRTVIPCGTVRGVAPLAPAVPSTHHCGSVYNCPPPQPTSSKSGFVRFTQVQLQILQSSSWNST